MKINIWKWVLGVPFALFTFIMVVGAFLSGTPKAEARLKDREVIKGCWDIQSKKSLDPAMARLTVGACERMEDEFKAKYGHNP